MKRLISLLLVLSLFMGASAIASALSPNIIPMWEHIRQITNVISFDGLNGEASAYVLGKSGTDSISASLTVYRQSGNSWVYVTSTSDTSSTIQLSLDCDFSATSGTYYKSVFEVVVTINGIEESETKTSYKTCP